MKMTKWFRPPKVVKAFWRQFKRLFAGIVMIAAMTFGLSGYTADATAYGSTVLAAEIPPNAQALFNPPTTRVTNVKQALVRWWKLGVAISKAMTGAVTLALIAGLWFTAILFKKCVLAMIAYGRNALRAIKNLKRLGKFMSQRLYAWWLARLP